MINNKIVTLAGFILMMLALMKPLHAEPRIIITNAFVAKENSILSNLSATWTTIESSDSFPTSLHPYDQGYRSYGSAIQGREFKDPEKTIYTDYWDTLSGAERPKVVIQPDDTWATLAEKYAKLVGASGTGQWFHYTPASGHYELIRACIAVTEINSQTTYYGVTPDLQSCSNIPLAPNPAQCDLEIMGSNTIDHGTLLDTEVNGHVKTTTVNLKCTKPAAVEFRLLKHPVELGSGITSTITIEGSSSPVIDVNDVKNVTIASRLSATNPAPGPFKGNVIVIANVQ
ncbi:hypothetical protein [Klebsiella oxytoca]|uniref:hypothetical protein n=1 Tax=Klebsiella oxytoca TaxID=571 RepID=UPI00157B1F17|nr:hypothetical protein [Klebsiella oxytoca]